MVDMNLLCEECKVKIEGVLKERFGHLDGMSKIRAMRLLVKAAGEIHTIYYDNACEACKAKIMRAANK